MSGVVEPRLKTKKAAIRVVSGWRGVGKTTWCRRLVARGRARGLACAGLLSPARFAASADLGGPVVKTGIEVEDVRTGQRRLLASRLAGELHGLQLGPWTFDEAILAWGNQVLAATTACDILVIDELGPLEFDQQQGWAAGFDLIERRCYRLAVVVVRPEYLEPFQQRWPQASVITLPFCPQPI